MAVKNSFEAFGRLARASTNIDNTFRRVDSLAAITPYDGSVSIVRIINATDQDININYDGSTGADDFLPSGETLVLQPQSNALPPAYASTFPKNFGVWVSGTTGAGNVYVSAYGNVQR